MKFLLNFRRVAAFVIFVILLTSSPGSGLRADRRPVPNNLFQISPQALPTASTNISTLGNGVPALGVDVYVCRLDLNIIPNGGAVNITIQTNESTPHYFWNAISITATSSTVGTAYSVIAASSPDGCVYFPKGMTMFASATGVTIGALSGRY